MSAHEKDCDRKGLCESARKRSRGIPRESARARGIVSEIYCARETLARERERARGIPREIARGISRKSARETLERESEIEREGL